MEMASHAFMNNAVILAILLHFFVQNISSTISVKRQDVLVHLNQTLNTATFTLEKAAAQIVETGLTPVKVRKSMMATVLFVLRIVFQKIHAQQISAVKLYKIKFNHFLIYILQDLYMKHLYTLITVSASTDVELITIYA